MKPRIVILSAFLSPLRSGAEACAEEVPQLLQDQFDFTIVTARLRRAPHPSPASIHFCFDKNTRHDTRGEGIDVIRVGIGHPIDKWLFPFLAPFAVRKLSFLDGACPEFYRRARNDTLIIHAVLESFAGLAMVFCKILCPRAKTILTCQSTNTSILLGLMHRSADRITAISSVLVERAKKFGRNDVVRIPNGIHVKAFEEARRKYQKVPGRILFVGRLEKMKGVDVLLTAFAIMNQELGIKNQGVHLHIVGDGTLRSKLQTENYKLQTHRVTFLGRLDGQALLREYAEAEIFCALPRSEALGNVFLEAQAAGCAVVATNVGGIPDIVEDGVTGWLILPDDAAAAAEAIQKLCDDEQLRARFARAGIEHAQKYDWQGIAKKYAELYWQK